MIRRFLTRILIVALIAVCGYNGWQVHQLQGQVERLQAQVQASRGKNALRTSEDASPIDKSWLDQADLHAARARAAVLRADFPTAQRELQRGVDDVHHAVQEPEEKTQATLGQARHTLASLQSQADSLWRKVHTARSGSIP